MKPLRCLLAGLVLAGALAAPMTSRAAFAQNDQVVVVRPVGLTEAALSSCAGGAVIGYLLVFASGMGSANGTAALFCGLSAAATVTSAVTSAIWRGTASLLP